MMNRIDELMKKAPTKDIFPDVSENDREETRHIVTLADEIYYRRKELGMTQKDLANALGVSQSMISQCESGEYNFTIGMLVRIFKALNVEFEFTFHDRPEADTGEYFGEKALSSTVLPFRVSVPDEAKEE